MRANGLGPGMSGHRFSARIVQGCIGVCESCACCHRTGMLCCAVTSLSHASMQPCDMLHAGERNERVEQLEGDILEMKQIFRETLEASALGR